MANEDHLAILKRGVETWNQWRQANPEVVPNLSRSDLCGAILTGINFEGADLSLAYLRGADLTKANLSGAKLSSYLEGANLGHAILTHASLYAALLDSTTFSGANLSRAYLSGAFASRANFRDANLRGANLSARLVGAIFSGADLGQANLSGSDLTDADLSCANLTGATLVHAKVTGADFNEARIGLTTFGHMDLNSVRGLNTVKHSSRSEIGNATIGQSKGAIPEAFLRGCGLQEWEIEAAKLYRTDLTPGQASEILYRVHHLRTNPAIQFNSCFISYSSKDQAFAERLYNQLQDAGVRCWFAPEHLKIGDRFRQRIDEAIRLHDKLLLVLSKHSLASSWVEEEVEGALEKERRRKTAVLFPIRIDEAVSRSRKAWAASLRRTRHIGDFSLCEDEASYSKAFKRLLSDLKAGA